MTWHSARDGDGHRVHIWEEKGVRGEGDTPGGFTRAIQSRLPVLKKKEVKGKNLNWPVKNKREKRENFIFPLQSPPLFSLPPVIFPSLFAPSLFCSYPKSFSFSLLSFLYYHHPLLICHTQTCFPGPAIHRYCIHQQ